MLKTSFVTGDFQVNVKGLFVTGDFQVNVKGLFVTRDFQNIKWTSEHPKLILYFLMIARNCGASKLRVEVILSRKLRLFGIV